MNEIPYGRDRENISFMDKNGKKVEKSKKRSYNERKTFGRTKEISKSAQTKSDKSSYGGEMP
ncbi:MAG: hypothetical protein ACLR4A_11055 [Christensenellales bacterium]